MKQFFSFFSGRGRLLSFTERLSELVSGGISLQKSLGILGTLSSGDEQLSRVCRSLQKSVSEGTTFSAAMKIAPALRVPDWYIAYISVAEECGCLEAILRHLHTMLRREKEAGEKLLSALCYPLAVMLLTGGAGFCSVFFFLPSVLPLFGGDAALVQETAVRTMLRADVLLACIFVLIVLSVARGIRMNPCVTVFRTMAFLSEHAVPTLSAVSCAFAFSEKNRKIAEALLSVRAELLEGSGVSSCFGRCFEKSGFKKEGFLLSEQLSLCEETGKKNGFAKSADYLSARKERQEKILLSLLQPVLLALSSLYITLILKTAFLPYITQFGDLL